METLQVRIDDEDLVELRELMRFLRMSKSEVARNALAEGLKRLKMDIAMRKYIKGEFTLDRAAEFARSNVVEMAEYLAEHGVSYFRYDASEVAQDAEVAGKGIRRTKRR